MNMCLHFKSFINNQTLHTVEMHYQRRHPNFALTIWWPLITRRRLQKPTEQKSVIDRKSLCKQKSFYIYIYIYIKWTMFVNVATKSAQPAHAWMITTVVEKVQTQIICEHGFMNIKWRHARVLMHAGIVNPRWREKRSRHYRRMRNS